jgi:MoxR-like ATPase
MQERQVTVGRVRHRLADPFFVLATQNPIEQEGTYPLPEAQLDRFFFKLIVKAPSRKEIGTILDRTTKTENIEINKIMDGPELMQWQSLAREVLIAPPVQDYAIRLILATHPQGEFAASVANQYLRFGSSPRGAQALVLASKVRALLEGRYNVSFEDIRQAFYPALRHRVLLNFEAQAERIDADQVLKGILDHVSEKAADLAA